MGRQTNRILVGLLALGLPTGALACGGTHTVQPGESIFMIAEQAYGDHQNWSAIYYGNQAELGGDTFLNLKPGTVLSIPCLDADGTPEEKPLLVEEAEMTLVTGSDYAPFTDRGWPGQGMVFELVNAALEATPHALPYAITWEDDWSKHLFPMLDEKEVDMSFPWLRPDCEAEPGNERCANFHFSEPLVELLILLFTRADDPLVFETDDDIHGATLCRPVGYFTHDLDRADRRWLAEGKIDLVQAEDPDACFALLMDGKVDAVTFNEFLGWTKIHDLGLEDDVIAVKRPLSIEGLHVLISKRHWRGTTHLYRFNAGLEALKASDRYEQIVAKHLGIFWSRVEGRPEG